MKFTIKLLLRKFYIFYLITKFMEKDIGKIAKNNDTDIMIRIDDFGGKVGLTIREFVKSERYTGFTKAGTRIPAEKFSEFKKIINSIDEKMLSHTESSKSVTDKSDHNKVDKKKEEEEEEIVEEEEF